MAAFTELLKARSRRFLLLGSIGSFFVTVGLVSLASVVFSLALPWLVAIAIASELTIYWLFFFLFRGITNYCGVCTQCCFSWILHVPMGDDTANGNCYRNKQPKVLISDRFAFIEVSISKYKLPGYVFKHRKRLVSNPVQRLKAKIYTKDVLYVILGFVVLIVFFISTCLLISALSATPKLAIAISSIEREAPLANAVLYNATIVDKTLAPSMNPMPFNLKYARDHNRLLFVEAHALIISDRGDQHVRRYRFWYADEPIERKFGQRRIIPCYIYTNSTGISRILKAQRNGDALNAKIFADSVTLNDTTLGGLK